MHLNLGVVQSCQYLAPRRMYTRACITYGGVLAGARPAEHKTTMENKESKRELFTQGVVGLLAGLLLVVAGIWIGGQLHIVWNVWPSTDGVVVRGDVQELLAAPQGKAGMPFHGYRPRVVFRYTVGGSTYITEAPSVYTADSFERATANLVRLYAPGTHHPIRYNPREPRDISFGVIEFGPLMFSFLLLLFGAAVSTVAVTWLTTAYSLGTQSSPAMEQKSLATVLPFAQRGGPEPSAAILQCPSCGRPVKANEDNCPNCLKALHAA